MSSKYDFGSSSSSDNNNSDDRGYAPSFKIAPFTKMEGDLNSLFITDSDYGMSVAVTYDNGKLVDGILTKRVDKEQYKLFSWNDAPVRFDETLSCDDLPPIMNKSYAGTSYKYEIMAARLQGDEEIGYDDDSTEATEDPIPLKAINGDDRFAVWEGSSEYGPNACAKRTVSVLSSAGPDGILDEDSQFAWAQEGISLRPDMEGTTITYAKVSRESNQSDHTFNQPMFILEGGDLLGNYNGNSEGAESSESDEDSDVNEASDDAQEAAGDESDPVQEFYDTCAELSINTEPAVIGLLEDMINDDDNDLTEDVVDRDEIVADLTA